MGREIKFRGLSKRIKKYVYGSYWFNPFTKPVNRLTVINIELKINLKK